MTDLWPRVEPLLERVARPSRYIDREFGASSGAAKDGEPGLLVCLCYPDTYEVGMSNLALGILYSLLGERADVTCERVYAPWPDMAAEMRGAGVQLFSLESCRPVREFDLLGITLQYELTYTNILELLDLAGIALRAEGRREDDPIVLGGGPCVANPEPVAPFFDAVLVGEAEEAMGEIVQALVEALASGASRQERVEALAKVEGVYVPALYEVRGGVVAPGAGAPWPVRRRLVADLDAVPVPRHVPVPFVEAVHDRLSVEVMRGCTRGCRFCQASTLYRPVRERSRRAIAGAARQLLGETGYEELSLTSLSTTDHSQIAEVLADLGTFTEERSIATSLPSLRADAFSVELAELVARVRRTGLTFAPEAGTQRLRDVVNKNVTEEQLMSAVERAVAGGWRRIKLYFMIGLPTETDADVVAIGELVGRVLKRARRAAGRERPGAVRVSVTVSTFVPKALTPFQWEGQLPGVEIERRQRLLRAATPRKGVSLSWHDPESSRLEGLLARGDRKMADLIEAAWRAGAWFDAWTERFRPELWWEAAERLGIDVAAEVERPREPSELLPWDHLDWGVRTEFLLAERERAMAGRVTEDCRFGPCPTCGVCQAYDVGNVLAAQRAG